MIYDRCILHTPHSMLITYFCIIIRCHTCTLRVFGDYVGYAHKGAKVAILQA